METLENMNHPLQNPRRRIKRTKTGEIGIEREMAKVTGTEIVTGEEIETG